jgi:hypothetical protein
MKAVALRSGLIAAALSLASCTAIPSPNAGALGLETVPNRADLISGGDVLVRVSLPVNADASRASLLLNGQPFREPGAGSPGQLHQSPDAGGWIALVGGLTDGRNTLTLTYGETRASLEVTNHPGGGPLFSGPQIQPWTCLDGALDAQCNRKATYTWSYMPAGATQFKPYNPASPPTDVGQTTTSGGVTMPYIVRVESFTQNRSGVSVAVLYNPAEEWSAWRQQKQWNRGVLVLQGAGCGTGYGEQPAGNPLNDRALKQGFAVVTVALLHNTINCNPVVQAEAALMAKEHVAETYGPFDFIFGTGSSGGAISQIMDQNAYPGIYDGLILNHLFSDSDASRTAAYDCRLISDAWANATQPWSEEQKSAVAGMLSGCNASPTRFQIYNPAVGTNCTIADDQRFDAVKNPGGVRCTLQDYEVNQVGRRPDGAANGRLDTVGVQYGFRALMAGTISPAQFVELNAAIGGHDINFNRTETRTEADRAGLARLYSTGLANTQNNLTETAIIETRLSVTDFHQPFHAVMVRARLDRAQGHHDNYALWRTPAAREAAMDASFDVMVEWLRSIRRDDRAVTKAQKVIDNKPALARDRCIVEGADAALSACPRPPELARVLAGAPDTNDSGKCQLKPLRRADYGKVAFTAEQWASLQRTFPSGVCDYSRPLVAFAYSKPWLAYSGNGEAHALGPAPKSR